MCVQEEEEKGGVRWEETLETEEKGKERREGELGGDSAKVFCSPSGFF